MTAWPVPSLRHLARLTDEIGIVEHARHGDPYPALGYCTDDAGRALAVVSQLADDPDAHRIATVAVRFLARAHRLDGTFRLRLTARGSWSPDRDSDDATGRAVLGLGTAAAGAPWPEVRTAAAGLFDAVAAFRSTHPRATAYAVLGAAELLRVAPDHAEARRLVADAAASLPRPASDPGWPWPAPRLTYANALLPDALLAAATVTGDAGLAATALSLLAWLVHEETHETWFSFTPVGGRGRGDVKPAFDQQPIEAWAMVDACRRAHACSGADRWVAFADRAARWFLGDNDLHLPVYDPTTGGGFDGLQRGGVNRNQGAESTLAFVASMHSARSLARPAQAACDDLAAARDSRR